MRLRNGRQQTTLSRRCFTSTPSVAVDGAGNLYVWDIQYIAKWTAASQSLSDVFYWLQSLYGTGLGLAVDGAGNVYLSSYWESGSFGYGYTLREWNTASSTLSCTARWRHESLGWRGGRWRGRGLFCHHQHDQSEYRIGQHHAGSSGLSHPSGVAVDGAGNVYYRRRWLTNAIKELPRAFVDSTAKSEGPGLPAAMCCRWCCRPRQSARPVLPPRSDDAWLTITGITNGVVSFALSANTGGANRTPILPCWCNRSP